MDSSSVRLLSLASGSLLPSVAKCESSLRSQLPSEIAPLSLDAERSLRHVAQLSSRTFWTSAREFSPFNTARVFDGRLTVIETRFCVSYLLGRCAVRSSNARLEVPCPWGQLGFFAEVNASHLTWCESMCEYHARRWSTSAATAFPRPEQAEALAGTMRRRNPRGRFIDDYIVLV